MSSEFQPAVLFEDNHLLALLKPAGMLTQGDATGDRSLMDAAKDYLRVKYAKPGQVFLGMVHRLDRPVGGVVLFARTSKAASRLSEQFRGRNVGKFYRAWVEGRMGAAEGRWEDALVVGESRTDIAPPGTPGAQTASLAWKVIRQEERRALVEIELHTGRKHQIRAQFAGHGHPVLGDQRYGTRQRPAPGPLALIAQRLVVEHPTTHERLVIEAPVPPEFQ